MRRIERTLGALALLGVMVALLGAAAPAGGPTIQIDDVTLFYKIYDAAGGHPTAEQLQHDYLDTGSEGLHTLAKLRNVTGVRIADTLAKRPEIYADAKRCTSMLPHARERLVAALDKLAELYPEAKFPPVTIAIGRGKPVGVGSPATGVQIGLEALCATTWMNPNVEDRFVHVIAHEFTHVQQNQTLDDDEHPTVLEASLIEGGAEFVAEIISGAPGYTYFGPMVTGHEKEIETAFAADEDKTDLSHWLYNSTRRQTGRSRLLGRIPHHEILLSARGRQASGVPRHHSDERPEGVPGQERVVSGDRAAIVHDWLTARASLASRHGARDEKQERCIPVCRPRHGGIRGRSRGRRRSASRIPESRTLTALSWRPHLSRGVRRDAGSSDGQTVPADVRGRARQRGLSPLFGRRAAGPPRYGYLRTP